MRNVHKAVRFFGALEMKNKNIVKCQKFSMVIFFVMVMLTGTGCNDINYPADVLDKSPYDMSGGSFVINNDEEFAYSQGVTLSCTVDNATLMQFSNDAHTWSNLQPYEPVVQWMLPLRYGEHVVFGRFQNSRGDTVQYEDSVFFIERLVHTAGTYLGGDVAISSDGSVVVAGSYEGNANAVYVFRKQQIDWDYTVIKPDDVQQGDKFGYSVALSGNGNWLFVGAPVKKAVYVYYYTNNSWQLKQTITSSTASFGNDVSTDTNGDYLIIIAYDGKAYSIYQKDGLQYTSKQTWTYAQSKPYSVQITKDAKYLFVGLNKENKGSVSVYSFPPPINGLFATITPGDNQDFAEFGRSISVTSDGSLCVIGAPGYSIQGNDNKGCFYVYQKSGNGYTLLAQMKNINGTIGDALGKAVCIVPNGLYIIASMSLSDEGGSDRGKVGVYKLNGTSLEYIDSYLPDDRYTKCFFGESLAVSNNGVIAIGAPYAYVDTTNDNGGVVYIRRLE